MKTEKNPYVGARTFEPDESELFFGREREAQDLLSLVVSDRLVLFYAQSGAGKSSLINTKLIPGLIEEEGFRAFPVGRLRRDEVIGTKTRNVYIYNLVTSLTKRNVDEAVLSKLSLSEYLAGLDYDDKDGYFYNENGPHDFFARAQKTSWKYVLIIDQFEELFTTYEEEWEKREDFFRQLTKAMDDFSGLWVVLVMREDYIAYMDPHRYLLPGKLRTRYYMQRLEKDRAVDAVEGPARVFNRSYAPGAAKKLVNELSNIMVRKPDNTWQPQPGQYVEPVQLQVVCSSLWGKLPEGVTTITAQDIEQYVGDLNQALGNFYGDRVKAAAEGKKAKEKGVKERDIRRWFEKELIIEGKRRNMVAEEPGGKSGGLDDEVVREFLGTLVREEKRSGGATFYELTHDRMVEPIIADNLRWKENSSPLQKQAALWDDQERNEKWLLSDQALVDVENWAKEHPDEMTEIENDFLAACHRHQAQLDEQRLQQRRELELSQKIARTAQTSKRFAVIASILAVASIIAGFLAWDSQRDAKKAEKVALEAKALAQQREDVARARELASKADEKLNEQLDLSMLLSVEAFQITEKNSDAKSMEAQSILFDNAQRSANLRGILANPTNPANQFRFSPDGKFVALTQQDEGSEDLVLWALDQDPPKKQILETGKVEMFFFSQDNRYLIYLNRNGVNRWNLETNTREETLNEHVGRVAQIIFHPDGKNYVTLGENGEITTWDTGTGASDRKEQSTRGDITVFSPDNGLFATYESAGTIVVGDILASAEDYKTINMDPYSVASMAFNKDGTQLVIADKDGGLTFWDIASNKELNDLAFTVPMTAEIEKIMYRPDGNLLVFNSVDGVAILNDTGTVDSWIKPQSQTGINVTFSDILLSADGTKLAISDSINQTTLYETKKGALISELDGTLAEFTEDGATLAIFDRDTKQVKLVDVASGILKGEPFPELQSPASSMKFSGDARLLAAGAADGSLKVWDVSSRNLKFSLPGNNSGPVSSLAFSPDNSQLIAGHTDSRLTQWLLAQPTAKTQKLNYTGRISSIGISPDGNYFYSIAGNSIVLLNMADFEHVITVTTDLPIDYIKLAADDQAAAIFEKGGGISLWNPSVSDTVPIDGNFVQFSPQKQIIETMDHENKLTLWSVLKGNKIAEGVTQGTNRYSPQEQYVVVMDSSGLIISQIYNVATGVVDSQIAGRQFIGFSPDDQMLLTSSNAGEFELWRMQSGEQVGKPFPAASSPVIFQSNDFDPGQVYYFSPKGQILVTSNPSSGKLELRNTETGDLLGEPIEGNKVVMINNAASRLITNSYLTGFNTLWDLDSQEALGQPNSGQLKQLDADGKKILQLSTGHEMVIMSDYSGMTLWDLNNGKKLGGPIEGNQIFFDKDNRSMAVSADYKVTLWDLIGMERIGEPIFGTSFIGLSADGGSVAMKTSVGGKDAIAIWNTQTSKQLGSAVVGLSTASFGIATFNPAGTIYATRNPNGFITLDQQSNTGSFEPQFVDTVIFSPKTDRLAIFNPNGTLTIWDTLSPTMPTKTIKDFEEPVLSVALSPDGKVLASSLKDGIALWNPVDTAKPDLHTNPHINEPMDVYLSPDGKSLVTSDRQSTPTVSLWDINTATRIGEPIKENFCGFSPDGRILITSPSAYTYSYGSSQYTYYAYCYAYPSANTYTFWDTSNGKQIGEGISGTYVFSLDYQYIVLQSAQDFKVLQFSDHNGSLEMIQVGDPIPGTFSRFGQDNETIFALQNGTTQVWNLDSKKREKPDMEIPGEVSTISLDDSTAVLREYQADKSKYVFRFWNLKENRQIGQPLDNVIGYYPSVSPMGGFVAGDTAKGIFSVWNVATGKSFSITGTFSGFSPDDKYAVARDGSTDNYSIWDTKTGKMLELAETLKGSYWGFYGPDSKFIVFRDSEAGNFVFYDPQNGNKIGTTGKADSILFSPKEEYFLTYLKGSISLWQTASIKQDTDFEASGQIVGFSGDNHTLVTTTTNQGKTEISLWRTDNGQQRGDTFTYQGTLSSIRFAQDGKLLVLFGNEGLYVWNLLEPDKQLEPIADPGGPINRMVFSPDSTMLATIGNDGVYVWSVTDRNQLTSLIPGNAGRITDVAFDGSSLILLNADGTVFRSQILDAHSEPIKIGSPVPNACKMVLSPDGKRVAYISGKNKLHLASVDGSSTAILDNKDVFCYGSLAFSVDSNTLAYTERDRIYVSSIDDKGQFGTPTEVAENPVSELTFILGNQILAANSGDGRILLWDVKERALLAAFNQGGTVRRSANGILQIYLPQERRVIKLDFNTEAWRASLKQWQQDLCKKAGRTLNVDEWQQYFATEGEYPDQPSCPMPPPPSSE